MEILSVRPSTISNTQEHSDEQQKQQNTLQLCCSFFLWISRKYPLETNKQSCKQTSRQVNHACTHSCPYRGPDTTECSCCVPAVLSPEKPSQGKPDSGLWNPCVVGAPVN